MRADHRDRDFVAAHARRQTRKRRLRQAPRAHRQFRIGMKNPADAGELRVVSGGRQQRDAEGNPVAADSRRQREAAEVEQIDKVGVGAEPGVELDRIGQHLRRGVHGRRRRQHQRVEDGEGALGYLAQRLQPVQRRKGVGGAEPRPADDDLARHRMERFRRRRQQISDHEISLGDPRSFIEQPRGLIKRLEVESDQRGAQRGPALERLAVRFLRRLVAEEDQLAVARHAQPEVCGKRRHLRQRPVTRIGIGAVGTGHRRQGRHRVINAEREHRHAIQRPACRHHACGGDQSKTRLQPDDVVEHRGHPSGARGVSAQGQRHHPGRYGHCRS